MTRIKLFLTIIFVLTIGKFSAQITSATLNGKVIDGDMPVVNVKIVVTYLPTNTVFETITDKKGRFSLDNLDVGGPYNILVKDDSIEDYSRKGYNLSLGENDLPRPLIVRRKESNVSQENNSTDKAN